MSQYLIGTVTVGAGGQATIDFTSIPQTFTDLVIVLSARSTNSAATGSLYMSINGVTTNRTARLLYGNGSSAGSATLSDHFLFDIVGNTATANTFSNSVFYFPNYAGNTNKSFSVDSVNENNATASNQYLEAGLWSNTAAITSLSFTPNTGTFVQGSTASLYGIKNYVLASAKATGGTILADANYVYHIFTASGTFTPKTNLTADFLVVAGGGGGGDLGGGAGAGGYRTSVGTSGGGASAEGQLSLNSSTNYAVTVGAGGAGAASSGYPNSTTPLGTSGADSSFSSIVSIGGGRGGGWDNQAGLSGGSGAGKGGNATGSGYAGTAGQGYAGGAQNGNTFPGGGGGGAGAVGAGTSGDNAGNGGAGVTSTITGTSVTYAGGGGGGAWSGTAGAGGAGGGGAGGNNGAAGTAGAANTGGGGGSGGFNMAFGAGGAGGSGIVVIRYAK